MTDTCKSYRFWGLVDKKTGVVIYNKIFDSRSGARAEKRRLVDGDEYTVKQIKITW